MQKKRDKEKLLAFLFVVGFIIISFVFFLNIMVERDIIEGVTPLFKIGYDEGESNFSLSKELNDLAEIFYGVNFKKPLNHIDLKLPVMGLVFAQLCNDEEYYGEVSFDEENFDTNQSSIFFEPEHDLEDGVYKNLGDLKFIKEPNVDIDLDKLELEKIRIPKEKKGYRVMIYHTHTTESYVGRSLQNNIISLGSGTVVDVGNKLKKVLEQKYNISVLHNTTDHTRPELRTAYIRSLETVRNVLADFSSIDVLIDLHRDGLANVDRFAPKIEVDGKYVAQIMIVVGTDFSGLKHPNWQQNLAFAVSLQELLEEVCPGITRPIYISRHRYNQHLLDNAVILEVGGNGNTLEEAKRSAEFLAKALSRMF